MLTSNAEQENEASISLAVNNLYTNPYILGKSVAHT